MKKQFPSLKSPEAFGGTPSMNELKIVLFPLLTLLGVLLFAGIAGNTLWVRLGEVRKNLEAAGKENNTLGQKVEVLQRKSR